MRSELLVNTITKQFPNALTLTTGNGYVFEHEDFHLHIQLRHEPGDEAVLVKTINPAVTDSASTRAVICCLAKFCVIAPYILWAEDVPEAEVSFWESVGFVSIDTPLLGHDTDDFIYADHLARFNIY
jgi:hypothetical protein